MEIREYVSDDFKRVVEILKMSFPEIDMCLARSLVNSKVLDLEDSNHTQLVAVLNDKVVGYALVSRTFDPIIKRINYWIDYVCVDTEYRGRGIARGLLMRIEEMANGENVHYLQLTSSRFRTSARKLYLDFGFEIRESDIFRKVIG